MRLSIISPVYKAYNIIDELIMRIINSVEPITPDYEIILVDDACPENSWEKIELLAKNNSKIKGIKLSRNFGQHYAITAGLDHAIGDWVVVMDCDLQDQPEEINKLYNKALEGFDIVLAQRNNRKDTILKRTYSKLFYRTLGYLTGSDQDEAIANFGIYSMKAVDEIVKMRESIRYFPTMVKWVGFKTAKVPVEHADRKEGKSSYNFKRMLNLALDIILAFSDKPLRLTIKLGFYISIIAILMALYTLLKWMSGGIVVIGYASLITSIWFLSGCILITLGVVGLYVGKTFEGVKKRPLYIIEKKINNDDI
ncbi:MAG: glycosyltransferase family 2 protein [Bacteroidota bacterium]|nr:glycosyltransferase family 2 protein [Bacteroidota bacterium]